MRQNERILENECKRIARTHGWVCVKLEKNAHKGIPDDLFLHPDGRYHLIEFKKDEKQKPRPEQIVWLEKFPMTSHLVGSMEAFLAVLGIKI